jgi:hypothetical protein
LAFRAYWCGLIENECPDIATWLFEVDVEPVAVYLGITIALGMYLYFCGCLFQWGELVHISPIPLRFPLTIQRSRVIER